MKVSLIALALFTTLVSCGAGEEIFAEEPMAQKQGSSSESFLLNVEAISHEIYELSESQKAKLIALHHDERLAYELYKKFSEKYNLPKFKNIAKAEMKHREAVEFLLKKYQLEIPTESEGKYNNPEVQELYHTLLSKGLSSEAGAIAVGIEVEKLDITDLNDAIKEATPDVAYVFNKLLEGSKSHLKAFENNTNGQKGVQRKNPR